MKRPIAVAVASAILACSGPGPYSFAVDSAFPPARRDDVLHAMDAWNAVTFPDHFLDIDGDHWRIYYSAKPIADCAGTAGCERTGERKIWIEPGLGPGTYTVALHELGHALGLRHTCALAGQPFAPGAPPCTNVYRGVMDAHPVSTFTQADLAECRRVGACPP